MPEAASTIIKAMTSRASDSVSLHTAGFVRRTVGATLDAIPAVTLWGTATLTLAGEGAVALPPGQWNLLDRLVDVLNMTPGLILWPLAWLTLALVLWHFVTVAAWGTSPGKRVVGLRMLDGRGERVSSVRALMHALMRPVTGACLALGPLWALADPERRTLYDRLSGVYIASAPASATPNRRRSST